MLGYWIGFVMALSVPAQVEGALCDGQPNGTECWQKLSSHSDCYFWTDLYVRGPSFEWTGDCVDGLAQGRGRLEWSSPPREDGFPGSARGESGLLQDGKKRGHWVEGFFDGLHGGKDDGPYVEGMKHGEWVHDYHGAWVQRGPYVDGQRHGHWVESDGYVGMVSEGTYAEDVRDGLWVTRYADGTVESEGRYVEGERHGRWVERDRDGNVEEGPYVEGERHGDWVTRYADGDVENSTYVNGRRGQLGRPGVLAVGAGEASESALQIVGRV